jgi:hypothetical protein
MRRLPVAESNMPGSVPIEMGELPSRIVRRSDEVRRVFVAQDRQCLFISALLDVAVCGKIPT